MRTVADIKSEMTALWLADAAVRDKYGLDPAKTFDQQFSQASLESILFYIMAYCAWTLEAMLGVHQREVADYITRMKPHTAGWYATVAKAFQYGFGLLPDSDGFNNTGYSEDEIEASKIVKYAAVIEQGNRLQIKVAKIDNGDLAELEAGELAAFAEYMERVRDAGVPVTILTGAADALKLRLRIFYSPLILNYEGKRIDGTNDTPVAQAIRNYLANIEFDGTFVLAKLIDAIQQVEGVEIPYPELVQYKFTGNGNWYDVQVRYRPSSGYLRIANEDLTIIYEPN
jgi:hypothetical protein